MAPLHATVLFVTEGARVIALRVVHRLSGDDAAQQALTAAARDWACTAEAAPIIRLQDGRLCWRNTPAIPGALLARHGIVSVERRALPDGRAVHDAVLDGAANLLGA